mgnify:CR=1 FL=1|jgi:hypothetical protein
MKSLKLSLDDTTYEQLRARCGGDEEAMKDFIAKAIEGWLGDSYHKTSEDPEKNIGNLSDYLKSSKSGTRSYGIKGQGW